MISMGPFSIRVVIVVVAAMAAWLITRLVARQLPDSGAKTASGVILDALFIGLITARIAFVLVWWKDYLANPLAMLAVGDGGFYVTAGVLASISWVWWKTRSKQLLRKPVYAGILAGLLAWGAANGTLAFLQRSAPSLPVLQLSTIDSQPIALTRFAGQPVVVNLWATWCPPCRREMPVFVKAQAEYPNIAFVLINQGETAQVIKNYLDAQGLKLQHILLDPASLVMQEIGSRGLPTTLFFDAKGRMVHSHMGELTMPGLKSTLNSHFGQ
ncbi:prolipoprotein diacylglyceryl transferase family protein [Eoetvoesiella caeni]|uniref:Thiol-disulfide isomerase/thioredoxin n=1 Tax=Eoetvoesiella caeni TaxID=645616 RepID=A0A366H2H9_9BURK|nr:prolipoprotein diacylglyceryl transferase family protein [Eoetvoesiella caeni]MCI2808326.1 redoxin family protein [Eoetvoesiella caeni]NYT53670.1 redoxin family protein [Eoetvoesiella caeni]RBP35996.1 thiol-disulfide isomerase/thioredoxin [Eoetvoesiella caeni]